jgi:dihydroorotate dehydrogenase
MVANTADKVKGALDRVVDKVEKATDAVVVNLESVSNETLNKLGMFHGVNTLLDEMIDGHNGGPPLDK